MNQIFPPSNYLFAEISVRSLIGLIVIHLQSSLNYLVATPNSYSWPSGTYGLPRPRLGCPQSYGSKWKTGWRHQDTEDSKPSNKHSDILNMDAIIWKNMNTSFCIKEKDNPAGNEGTWPKGIYNNFRTF